MSNKSATSAKATGSTAIEIHNGELGHGNSPAAWTCVAVMLFGALVSCVAFVIGSAATIVFIIGIVIMFIGLIAGWVMRKAGYGVGGSKLKNTGH